MGTTTELHDVMWCSTIPCRDVHGCCRYTCPPCGHVASEHSGEALMLFARSPVAKGTLQYSRDGASLAEAGVCRFSAPTGLQSLGAVDGTCTHTSRAPRTPWDRPKRPASKHEPGLKRTLPGPPVPTCDLSLGGSYVFGSH